MVLRFLIRVLANNEQLVQKISESYPVRKAAQFVVRAVFQSKHVLEEKGLDKMKTPEEFRAAMREIARHFQGQIKQASEEFKQRMK